MPLVRAPKKSPGTTTRIPKKTTGTVSYTGGGVFGKRFCTRHGITAEDYKRMEVAEVTIITMTRKQLLKTLVLMGIFEITIIVLLLRLVLPPN